MRLRRDASIAREKSINFDFFFHTWSDINDRGPGPLSSDKILKNKFLKKLLTFPERLMPHDEGAFLC